MHLASSLHHEYTKSRDCITVPEEYIGFMKQTVVNTVKRYYFIV